MTCNANCRCCKGACCCGSQCTQETCQDCEDAHGVWAGPGTQCANQECDQPTGACCGEACAILSECECLQGGGEYQGDDTTCDPDPCGETVCSGPCDEENPCPEGCVCVDGECVAVSCFGLCGPNSPCGPGCVCCQGTCTPASDVTTFCRAFASRCDFQWPDENTGECPDGYAEDAALGPGCWQCGPCPDGFPLGGGPGTTLCYRDIASLTNDGCDDPNACPNDVLAPDGLPYGGCLCSFNQLP